MPRVSSRLVRSSQIRSVPACFLAILFSGCGGSERWPAEHGNVTRAAAISRADQLATCSCTFDPAAGDSSVPPELGGPDFTGEGWQTAAEIPALGNAAAPKGGTAILAIHDWPATFRVAGAGWNQKFNGIVSAVCYESLLNVHPVTLEFVPGLASHWQISPDKMTYRFRLDPRARWSDGHEVTAEDVIATMRLKIDPGASDPSAVTLSRMNLPRALSKYMLEVEAKGLSWKSFHYISGMPILPAHEIGAIDGQTYLDRYQFKYTAVTGPYHVQADDIVSGVSITLSRRPDYWGREQCFARGLWHLDRVKFVVVKDENLAFEKLKAGEIDIFTVEKAQWWAEEVDKIDGVRRGLIQKRQVFTDVPIGVNGLALNTRRPPLDDLRVRLALCHLLNRDLIIEKLFFNEYEILSSYFQGGIYQNPANRPPSYDPENAATLLSEAGWTERGPDGLLIRAGKQLELGVQYDSKRSERYLTIFQEDCLRAGIKLDLVLVTPATKWKNLMDRQFDLSLVNWSGLDFPNPETTFSSRLAGTKDNNNLTGLSDARVDELCELYEHTFDVRERMRIVREIDGIVFGQHHYILTWYAPSTRLLFWNKFGQPPWYVNRTGDELPFSWWIEAENQARARAGKVDPRITMPKGETEVRYWEHLGDREEALATSPL